MTRRFRGDRAPHQTDEYIDANYEPDNNDARLYIDDETKALVRRAAERAGTAPRGGWHD